MPRPITRLTIAALALTGAALPLCAHAQEFNGKATLGYGMYTFDADELNFDHYTADATGTYQFGNGVWLGFDVGAQRLAFDEIDFDLDTQTVAVEGGYRFGSGLGLGAYYERTSIDNEVDFDSYGLTASYATDLWELEAFYGQGEADQFDGEFDEYGIRGSITASDRLALAGAIMRSESDVGDAQAIRIGGAYGITDSWMIFAGVEHLDLDGTEFTTSGLGVGYDFGGLTGVPSVLSLEVGHTNGDEQIDVGSVKLGLTFPFGPDADKVPLNTVAGNAMRDRRSAISSGFNTGFPLF